MRLMVKEVDGQYSWSCRGCKPIPLEYEVTCTPIYSHCHSEPSSVDAIIQRLVRAKRAIGDDVIRMKIDYDSKYPMETEFKFYLYPTNDMNLECTIALLKTVLKGVVDIQMIKPII